MTTRVLAHIEIIEETQDGCPPQHLIRSTVQWGTPKQDIVTVGYLLAAYSQWLAEVNLNVQVLPMQMPAADEDKTVAVVEVPGEPAQTETWRDQYGLGRADP